jgi:hypothetical protein
MTARFDLLQSPVLPEVPARRIATFYAQDEATLLARLTECAPRMEADEVLVAVNGEALRMLLGLAVRK